MEEKSYQWRELAVWLKKRVELVPLTPPPRRRTPLLTSAPRLSPPPDTSTFRSLYCLSLNAGLVPRRCRRHPLALRLRHRRRSRERVPRPQSCRLLPHQRRRQQQGHQVTPVPGRGRKWHVEYQPNGEHYRKKDFCRVSSVLLSVFSGTRQRVPLPSVFLEH
jgi:hypothetical protein